MSEQDYQIFSDFHPQLDEFESAPGQDLMLEYSPARNSDIYLKESEEWESWLSLHEKPDLHEEEPDLSKCFVKEFRQESDSSWFVYTLADSPHYSETTILTDENHQQRAYDQFIGDFESDNPTKIVKPITVQPIESNTQYFRESSNGKRSRCSASKKYPGQLSVGFAKYMIKEILNPRDPVDSKLITLLKSRINGRSKKIDKKDEYKLSSAEKVFAFFHGQGEHLTEDEKKVRGKLKQHFHNFFEKGLWEEWLRIYFKGDVDSRFWITRNIKEIQKKLFNPEYQPFFKHNDDTPN